MPQNILLVLESYVPHPCTPILFKFESEYITIHFSVLETFQSKPLDSMSNCKADTFGNGSTFLFASPTVQLLAAGQVLQCICNNNENLLYSTVPIHLILLVFLSVHIFIPNLAHQFSSTIKLSNHLGQIHIIFFALVFIVLHHSSLLFKD